MINIIRGTSKKYVTAEQLASYFDKRTDLEGILYIGYPILAASEGSYEIDAMLVSEQYGIVIFDMVVGNEISDRTEIQDDLYRTIQSRLLQNKKLVKKRNLMVNINVVTFASAWKIDEDSEENDFDLVISEDDLSSYLHDQKWSHPEYYRQLVEEIQAITTIRSRLKRTKVTKVDSKGAKLIELEESIANLDSTQSAAVIETVEGPQRIRGLAGSGKTIILALKVAYLHANNPDWDIAVTFNTRSLKDQFTDLITRFVYEHAREEVDWNKIKIIHAWGSPRVTGVYYEICRKHGIPYYDLGSAKEKSSGEPFDFVCKQALLDIKEFKPLYDVILVDEAQDFSKEFLNLCYNILREPRRLIYAYDELQNLNHNQMESPEEIFGEDDTGAPLVVLKNEDKKPKQDIILQTCYRNSRPLLATAHALGFGIYREKGIIQMFDQSWLWKDVGYRVKEGQLKDGSHVRLQRTADSSPLFLENHSTIEDLIIFKKLENAKQQANYIAQEIQKNLVEDELEYQDIIVIHTDPFYTKTAVGPVREALFKMGINSHIAGVTNSKDSFYEENSITFTSIYRAKGNEAAMVYVMDAQNCFEGYGLERKRNILFTSITRSKAWVRVSGYGDEMLGLQKEFEKVKNKDFELDFVYPTEEQRGKMNKVNRDMTEEERRLRASKVDNFSEMVKDLAKGEFFIEDLPQEVLDMLKERLKNE